MAHLRAYLRAFSVLVIIVLVASQGLIPASADCGAITFPYTLPNNNPATLITAIECANANGASADEINLGGAGVGITTSYANYGGATGLPEITTPITIRNGLLTRIGVNQFRFLYVAPTGNLTMRDMTLNNGFLPFDLGGAILSDSTLTLRNSIFTSNRASSGGAIYTVGTLTVLNSTFSENEAVNGGAAVATENTSTILNSTFNGNEITSSGNGSALSLSGATQIRNTVVSGNSGGVAIALFSGSSTLTNTTITGNYTTDPRGGILASGGSTSVLIRNSLVWNNSNAGIGVVSGASGSTESSIVQGINPDGPLFVTPLTLSAIPKTGGDFRLLPNSPGIDAGNNIYVVADTFDLDGDSNTSENTPDRDLNTRRYDDTGVADTGIGTAPIVDMGAYEKQTNSPSDPCAPITFPYTLPNNTPATLITAIECANANGASADTIDLDGQTVTLTASYADYIGATGLPQITTEITLRNGTITRTGSNEFRLLSASTSAILRLDDLTLTNGGGATYVGAGAGLRSFGSLYLTEVTMTGHQSTVQGGAIVIQSLPGGADLEIVDSTLSGNTAQGGSAVYFAPTGGGSMSISGSTFANNIGTGGPGAVFVSGTGAVMSITNSTFSANASTNTASPDAIGVFSSASASIAFTTFSGHDNGSSASTVGIIHAASGASIDMVASVIANNPRTGGGTARECTASSATFTGTRNYTADSFCPSRVATPQFVSTTLADNGGPTQTHLPAPHSNVVNNDTGNLCAPVNLNVTTDQRGEPRPIGPACDIGAVEIDACGSITFPYTLPDNAPATLNAAIDCANSTISTNDRIDLNGQTITLTVTSGNAGGETGLASIRSPITIQNGTITRTGSNQFRLLNVNLTGNLTLRDMTLTNGGGTTYGDGGGLISSDTGSTLTIVDSTLTGAVGSMGSSGGAIFASGTLNIVNSTVSGNQGGRGGAITAQNGPVVITNSVISGNVATNTSSSGGGAMFLASITVNDVRIINSTITGNYATGTGTARAGGIVGDATSGAELFIINSVVWGNSNNGGAAAQIVNSASNATNTVTNSLIQGGLFGALNSDPLFVTPLTASSTPSTAGDFALQNNSPAIDAGANADVPADTFDVNGNSNTSENAPDRAGNPRRYNDTAVADTGAGTAPIVDIGAYEKQTNSTVDPCLSITFPYTLSDNLAATLITAIECANANGTADVINLNGQTVTLTTSYGSYSGATGLPQITSNITLRNGTLTRTGSNEFRFLNVSNIGNLTVRDMTLTNGGGTTYAHNGGSILSQGTASTLTVVNTTVSGSRVDGVQNGSAIYSNAIFTIANSRIIGNGLGRGAIASINGPALIQNTLIAGNSAFDTINGGGGVYFGNILSATIVNSTITGNYVGTTLNTQPGGVLASGGTINLTIRNSIIWGNSNNGNTAPQVVNTTSGTNTVTNSLIQGGLFGALNSDPLFVTPITASGTPSTAGNFALQDGSPAIDAGANADVPADTFDVNGNSNTSENAPDVAGNTRRYDDTGVTDTGTGTAPIVDLGAYEKQTNSTVDPCAAITFPYILPDNAPATLITAIECANANGTADVIDLDGQTVTLTASYADYTGATGLPQITTDITLQDGTITRGGGNQFRLFSVGAAGNLTLNTIIATNGHGFAPGSVGGGGAIHSIGTVNLIDSRLSNHYSELDGGAVHNEGGSLYARNTIFSGNLTNVPGGGVGGAMANTNGIINLYNVLISGNRAVQGGGIYNNNNATLTLNNVTIAGNRTNDQGGGLRNENAAASAVLNNTLISGNQSTVFPANNDLGGVVTDNFSLIGGSPLFVAPEPPASAPTTTGDYRLGDGSPAVDAGDNSLMALLTDLDGNPRFYNDTGVADTGAGTAPLVDMGAYEKQTDSPVDPCAAITFPYTLPDNLAATLITAIECANANGASADTIDLDDQIVTLTASYASYSGATGLPQITTTITLENGTITRSSGAPQFRLMAVSSTGNLTVDRLTVSGGSLSSSDNAGAIYNDGGTLNVLNSTVTDNRAGFGGAFYNVGSAASVMLVDSRFINNDATENSGVMMNDGGSATIIRSRFSGNNGTGTAGNGVIFSTGSLDIIDSTFSGNASQASAGAVQNFGGTVNIANSVFAGNNAATSAGAILNNSAGVMTISNSTFTGNRAGNGAGAVLNNVSSTLTITNSTFAGNNAAANGGILMSNPSTLTITNSIVWGNNGSTLTGATITHSIIEGGFAGTGNLNVDPLFVAPVAFASAPTSSGNYRLQDNSPAVDAGSNAAVPVDTFDVNDNASTTDEAPDLDGNPRRYDDTGVTDTGSGTAPLVDMGAYEKQTNSPVAFPQDVDYCNLQFPTSFTAASNSTSPVIYGRIYEDDNGVFTSNPGSHPSIVGQVGYGPLGSDPRGGNPAWQWFPTTYNVQVGNDDEYQGTFTVPFAPTGTQRSYTYRFSVDSGANYTYCDSNGNGTNSGLGFSTADLGTLTIAPGGQPTISINDVSQNEGNSGTTNFNFTISLNGPSLSAVTFDIATANNTATVANSDYVSNSQTGFVIPAGQTSTAFTVVVNGDTTFEPNETFFVNLTNVTVATVADGQGTGTIVNDDVDPCAAVTFPYTLTGNTPAELILAIECANANGAGSDTINLNGQTVTLTEIYTSAYGSGTGLPEITTAVVIQNGTITRSSADLFRFFIYSGSSSLTLNNITLSNGNPEWDGGAIWGMGSSTLTINNSRIIGNYGNYGGAIFIPSSGTAVITNTLLSGNRASSPGGAIRNRGNLTLNNSTIAGNFTTAGTEGGGGIANNGGTVVLNNSIVYGNEASSFPATNDIRGTYTANNSLVGVNPSFINLLDAGDTAPTTGGDYRLADFSAAIDAGSNSLIPGGVTTDLDGNPRRVNDAGVADTGVGTAPIVDIGAYERQTNSVAPEADLSITKTDGVTSAVPGNTVTYTIVASNAGPSNAPSATVADTFPASLTSVTWTCGGAGGGTCTAAGSGNINDTVNLPVGGSVTYTVSATISASATGTLTNTATVTSAVTDPNPANNSATDTTTLTPQADLSITKTDGVTSAVPGGSVTYTIVASNAGPSNAPSATVADTFPASLTGVTWTCVGAGGGTCTAAGAGNISDTVNLPAGGSVTFTATGTINPAATGTLSNTATVTSAVTDPNPANNSATDTTTLTAPAGITVTPTTVNVTEGGATDTYTLVLDIQPSSDVTVELSYGGQVLVSTDGVNFFPSPVTVTFTSANWNIARTITVQANDDFAVEGAHNTSIDHDLTSADPLYNGLTGESVSVEITDNDAAGVVITESSGTPNDNAITVTEGGAGSSFAVVLTSQPASDVQVSMTFNGTIIEAGSPTLGNAPFSITFTSGNWNIPQIVNVGVVNDNVEVNHGSTNLSLVVGSADPNYTSIPTQPASPIIVTIIEDDAAGVVITESSGTPNDNAITVTEGGAGSSFAVVLTSQPASDVQVSMTFNGTIIEVGSPTLGNMPFSITFTSGNWNIPQIVNIGVVNDNIEVNHGSTNLSLVVGSTDPNYTSIPTQPASPIVVTIIEDDVAGVTVTPTTVNVTEGGATATYGVSLNTIPTADVTITVTGDAQASASPASLTFTPANWDIAQNVTVTAVDDLVVEGAHTGTITHSAAGGGYTGVSIASVTANITDNDVAAPTDLLLNGGFELGREGQPTLARNWVVIAPSVDNDIRFCKAVPAPQIYEGVCSFRFSFSGTIVDGTARSLTQTIDAPAVSAGDSLTLTAYVRAANLINRPRLLVRAIYADGTSQRIRITIPEGSYPYTEFTGSMTLTGTPTSIRVIVQPRTSEGLFFIDGMSLLVNAAPSTRASAPESGLLPLPPAP